MFFLQTLSIFVFVSFQAYIREGTALQQLGEHADALAAFASGLAHDTNSTGLLSGLIDAALKCPLKGIP